MIRSKPVSTQVDTQRPRQIANGFNRLTDNRLTDNRLF